ncbi:glycosyltransferase 87 family protein [Cellulomonas fimi]|uniref:glycosyltransferase 87 family protein n=1 Tax=Cellulomonas fimi TaxID=1708 RepID=UPI000F70FB82|nr:glycosyltransferase 87 family protein [Cellulomonas fimi]VEH36546.1 Predicted integral membrane protein [Cellulomonas fimi]
MHAWLAWVGVVWIPQKAFWDLELYRYWMWLGLHEGQWPVLSGDWVYPAGAVVPMLAAAAGGTAGGSGYATVWALLVTALDAGALGVLLHAPRLARPVGRSGHRHPHEPRVTTGAWWWIGFLALLGPIAMGRLDAVVAPVVVVALAVTLRHPRLSSVLLTVGAWVKVAPGALLLAVVVAVRRPWRDVVLPAAVVCVVVVGAVVAGGGAPHLLSFLGEQEDRGLQIEAVGATPWVVWGLWSDEVERFLNQPIVTWEVSGPGTAGAADALGALFVVGLAACAALLWWRRLHLGPRFWQDAVAQRELVVRGAMLLVLATIVFNKVGTPQYVGWLAPPVAVALALRLPGWRVTAWTVAGVAAATQVVFPWGYDQVLAGEPLVTAVLAARNVALVVLLVLTARALLRPPAHPLPGDAEVPASDAHPRTQGWASDAGGAPGVSPEVAPGTVSSPAGSP